MASLVDQLPALIGVLLGTSGTIFATWTVDRARWRRQQSARWDERRLQAYIEYADALKEIHAYALRLISAEMRLGSPGVDREDLLLKLSDADLRRTKTWEGVLLLGDARAVTAAREWREAVGAVARHAQQPVDGAFDVVTAVSHVNSCRDRFYESARLSLGITASFAPQSEWLEKELQAGVRPRANGGMSF